MDDNDKRIVTSLVKVSYFGCRGRSEHFMMRHTKYDRNSRVTELVLGTNGIPRFWDLPADIGGLSMLRKLELRYCRSLPTSLGSVDRLESLVLIQCDGNQLLSSLLGQQHHEKSALNFTVTKSLEIRGGLWNEHSMTRLIYWVSREENFPNLQNLRFLNLDTDILSAILDAFSSFTPSKQSSICNLTSLQFEFSGMSDQQLHRLLHEILPLFPKLSTLSLRGNQIKSLQQLQNYNCRAYLDGNARPVLSRSLRTMKLDNNPVLKHRSTLDEKAAFIVLLRDSLPLLGSILSWGNFDPEIEFWLRMNRAGRFLFMHDGESPPLSLWPRVLEAAYRSSSNGFKPSKNDATAVFYLIRNGPALTETIAASNDSV
jgi:hypothetical protein